MTKNRIYTAFKFIIKKCKYIFTVTYLKCTLLAVLVKPKTKFNHIKPENNEYKCSVMCLTYNHISFIKQTLDGFVKQKTNFNFCVYVADDASTDGTQDIIKEYAKKYPNIIKPILREKNIGVSKNAIEVLKKVDTVYYAVCDGDDYWIDDNKLQKQVDFLDTNKDYCVCCSNFIWHDVNKGTNNYIHITKDIMPHQMQKKHSFSFLDLLECRFIASCTCMVRWQMYKNIPEWLVNHVVIDFPIFLIHAGLGKIKVFDDIFSQYSYHSNGVSRNDGNSEYQKKMNDLIHFVNEYLNYQYDNVVKLYFSKRGIK